MKDQLLNAEETAERLRITVGTLYTWRWRRQGPVGFRIGNNAYWKEADVDGWIEEQYKAAKAVYDEAREHRR